MKNKSPESSEKEFPDNRLLITIVWLFTLLGLPIIFFFTVLPFLITISEPSYDDKVSERIRFIITNQKYFFYLNATFAKSLLELDTFEKTYIREYLRNGRNHSYDYVIVPLKEQAKSSYGAVIYAKPDKSSLPSLTGVIYYLSNKKFITGICQTNFPSQAPPVPPGIPKTYDESLECPSGSTLIWQER